MVIDRINRAIVRFLQRKSGATEARVVVEQARLAMVDNQDAELWQMPWSEMIRVTAFQSAGFVGSSIVLAFESTREKRLVPEGCPGWRELVDALEARLPDSVPYATWSLATVASEAAPVLIFARP